MNCFVRGVFTGHVYFLQGLPAILPSTFYAVPRSRPKRNFQNALDAIDTNESDFSCDDASDEEFFPNSQDSSTEGDEEGCADGGGSTSEEEDDRETVTAGDLKKNTPMAGSLGEKQLSNSRQ